MECSSTSYFNRKARCQRDRTFQEVSGKTSFRQEWPIKLCDELECKGEGESSKAAGQDGRDSCYGYDKGEEEEEGPLERFDQSIKDYMNMDVLGRDAPKHKDQNAHPSILTRTTKSTIETTAEQQAVEEDVNRAFAKKMAQLEKHFLFEQALMVAEQAADAAPPELVEEAALASAKGYTMTLESDRKGPVAVGGDTIVEVISYLGITRPVPEYTPEC